MKLNKQHSEFLRNVQKIRLMFVSSQLKWSDTAQQLDKHFEILKKKDKFAV